MGDITRYRPLQPGAQVGVCAFPANPTQGTLCCCVQSYLISGPAHFVFTPQNYWITCSHVMAVGNRRIIGKNVFQPDLGFDVFYLYHAGVVAAQVNGGTNAQVDAALIWMNDQIVNVGWGRGVPAYSGGCSNQLGNKAGVSLTGVSDPPLAQANPPKGQIRMIGQESGTVQGYVSLDRTTFNEVDDATGNKIWLTGFEIQLESKVVQGDSGGPVIDSANNLVGIATAAVETDMTRVKCCRASDVFKALSNELSNPAGNISVGLKLI